MNIFKTIERVAKQSAANRREPFLSGFLADAMKYSPMLSGAVWKLATPNWPIPENIKVRSEVSLDKLGRIDIVMEDELNKRIVGIEVKTMDQSGKFGQLERYRDGLENPERELAIVYLTPFNRKRAGDAADSLRTVKIFDEFSSKFQQAQHVSWLDLADITWDENELWKQLQAYVRETISSQDKLSPGIRRDREFAQFFGEDSAACFWEALAEQGVLPTEGKGAVIDLDEIEDIPSFAGVLVCALEDLIEENDRIRHDARKEDSFEEKLRKQFLDSPYREVHAALFRLSEKCGAVWIQGEKDYGVRVAHKDHPSGVSLVRSHGPGRLQTGQDR